MTLSDMSARERRLLVLGALGRSLITAVLLVVLYYLLPFTVINGSSIAVLVVGLIGISLLVAWEIRAIVKARYPAIQAVQALAAVLPLFLVLFATAYYLMEHDAPNSFSEHLSRTDAVYFTVTTFTTVGFGDITARSEGARVCVTIQMLLDLGLLGFGVKAVVGAVQMGRGRRQSGTDSVEPQTADVPVPARQSHES